MYMKRDILFYIAFAVFVGGLFVTASCKDELEVKSDYGFTVEHLPVPLRLKEGETTEIRFELLRAGKYAGAKYYVRYFQPEGSGVLRMDNRTLLPNDGYELKREEFQLYYTSYCEEQQVIDLVFYDSFKNRFELSFVFQHEAEKEDEPE
jgi:hypothetical protein